VGCRTLGSRSALAAKTGLVTGDGRAVGFSSLRRVSSLAPIARAGTGDGRLGGDEVAGVGLVSVEERTALCREVRFAVRVARGTLGVDDR